MKRGRLITIGSFDGVHRGHQALLQRTVDEANRRHLKTLALSFPVPPRMVLDQKARRLILSDEREKRALLRRFGMDEIQMLRFDAELSSMRPFNFFREILLNRFKARGVVVGSDFRFGAARAAGALELVRWGQEFGIPIWVISPVRFRRTVVSSTLIRALFQEGRFQAAADFLGHPPLIIGQVKSGRGVGRKIGFPTANIETSPDKILPRGVFAVRAWLEGGRKAKTSWKGVANIGVRPTFGGSSHLVLEVHLFADPGSLKGKTLGVELLRRLREEKKFPSPAALVAQIRKDVAQARRFFASRTASKA